MHLTEEGNRQLAEVIAQALLGKQVSASPSLEPLREAVLDKDMHWNNRYRASRRQRRVGRPLDAEPSPTIRPTPSCCSTSSSMLDVMTANRDERVWARASGKDKKVDDSNVPAARPGHLECRRREQELQRA